MLSPAFPPEIIFKLLDFRDLTPPTALPAEESLLSERAIEKRIFQFRAGRAAARAALEQLGFKPAPPLLRGPQGEPLWPANVKASITHCDQLAAAAATIAPEIKGIGLDLEGLRRPLRYNICSYIACPSEQEWIETLPKEQTTRTITMFSVKESIYKALFPICLQFFGFKDVVLTPTKPGTFLARLVKTLCPELPANLEFEVGYTLSAEYVLTHATLYNQI
ncbi:MAG: 4'-phosphopantetheinyl transferase superfamily protein [Deltaproteobacteria bacterium]|mgnify:CR=1 FL=1|nr:4'-phosphopantetheinyl transferase superfamily protein [Deltaproteobacteria bacterium]